MTFQPFPVLTTERLILRELKESDQELVLFLRSDKTVNAFIERPEDRQTKTTEDAIRFIKEIHGYAKSNTSIAWGITLKESPNIVGTICLWNFSEDRKIAEMGYDLHPNYQGLGIMSAALRLVLDYGFKTLKLDKIEAFTHKNNTSSIKLLERHGFVLMAHRKDEDNANNAIFEIVYPY
jgi:ribosomal-protein-alanine N-acetyltransferase